jgi:hypothetical protein
MAIGYLEQQEEIRPSHPTTLETGPKLKGNVEGKYRNMPYFNVFHGKYQASGGLSSKPSETQ